jgi:hypothetical protein
VLSLILAEVNEAFDLPAWLDTALVVLGILGSLGVAWAVLTTSSLKAKYSLIAEANESMATAIVFYKEQAEERDIEHKSQMVKMQSQIDFLKSDVMDKLSAQVHATVLAALKESHETLLSQLREMREENGRR